MPDFLIAIAAREKTTLRPGDIGALRDAAGHEGRWLGKGEAWEAPVGPDVRPLPDIDGVDIVRVSGEPRRKRLLLADMDSTMIRQECIDELAELAGLGGQVAAITERAMRGDIAFEPALRERVSLLSGLDTSVVERLLSDRIELSPGGRTLVATMRAHGARTVLVSGGFTDFAAPIAAAIGFDEHHANRLVRNGDRFTGEVAEPVLGRQAKQERLASLTVALGLSAAETLAVGDGANDAGMVAAAGLGVAYHAKPALEAVADVAIRHADLTALLYLQGYRRGEFVTP